MFTNNKFIYIYIYIGFGVDLPTMFYICYMHIVKYTV